MEDAVSCGATEEQKEPTTERMVGGQPHVEETITDKLNAVQSKDAHTQEEEEDRLVKTQQAEKDQGIKSQHNKDVLTMVGLKERSTAGEAEIEEAPKEWIKTIEISPDGNAKGEVLAWRELGAEPAKEGQKQAEQIPAGVIKTKQSELDAKAPSEHIKAQLSKTGMEKAKLPKMEETKAVHIKVDDGIKEKGKDELLRSEQINAEPSKVEKVKDLFRTKPVQAEKAKVSRETAKEEPNKAVTARDEQTNAEQARIERSQIEHAKAKRAISEKRMQHSVESLLIRKTEKEKLKQEPDKVEKVKMELAKAKAELAKVKDKMREEQKQKQSRHPIVSKLVDKYVLQEEKKPPQYQQRTEETPVRVPVDEYERLGEKYVFNKTALTNKIPITNPSSANDITSPSQEIERSPPHSDEGEEASDNNKPRDEEHPQGKAATKDKKRKPSVKHEELGENQYVYSESSKEFKLSNPNDSSSTLVTKQTEEICIDNNNKDKVMNAKPEPVSANVDSSQLRVFNMNPTKSFTHERKANPNKDTHSTPSRTLTHKERTQTKQQILTSKIKAHAEKEISAIKEKHSASGKGLQQRTPSQEGTKTLDKHIPSGHAPRDQQARVQVKSSLRNSVATPPVWSSNATMPPVLDSQVQKEEPLCVVKDTGTQQLKEVNQTKNNDNSNEELKQRENKPATKAMSQIKEQNPRSPGKEEVMRVNYIHQAAPQKPKADPPSKPEDEAHQTTDVAMWDTQEGPEFAPLMNLVLGQSEAPAAADDDSLQIMGIRVTVRARPETGSITDGNEAPEEAKIDSEANDNIKLPASLAFKTTKENIALRISNSLASQSTVGIEHTKVGANNHLENEPEESTDCLENKMADKRLTTHKESSLMRKTSHSHPVHQEDPVAATEDSSMVIKPAPNKPGKTQPILFKQGKITEKAKTETNLNKKCIEAKSKIKVNVEVGTDPSLAKETGLYSQMIPVKSDIKSCKMQSHPASLKCQVTDHVTSTKTDQVHDGGCVPLLVDKRTHPSLPEVDPEPQNSSSPNLKGYENVPISLGKQCTRTHSGENSPNEEHVHIGCIAIRVVQGEMEPDNKEKAVKELVETRNTERDKEDRATPLTPVKPFRQTNENAVQPVQHMTHDVFSLGSSNQSSKMTDSSETTREEDETHQQSCILEATVDDANNTKIQATEEDYFQFQGVTERHQELNNARLDGAGIQSLPKEHTEELGVPRASASGDVTSLPSEKVSVNTKLSSQQETKQVTNTDKVVDNARKTTMESDSATSESKSKSDKSELDSKKNIRLFPESQSNQRVTIEMGEDIQILKQAPQNTFHASGKERQSVRDSYTTRNNAVSASKEQPNLKQEAKSKPRVSTVPEISAIADYARLKVIAADDGPDKMQEFPPNKKEGFFPIIQSRHSRRPVFTEETPARQTVSKKTVSVEPELNHKINKEPKHLVFSTMEQDHKRTGMFKLRESVLSDAKTKEKGNAEIRPNPTETSRATPGDFLCCSQATVAGPELTNISQTNSQYSDQHNNSTTTERLKGSEVSTKHMAVPQKDNNSHQQAMFEEMSNREQNRGERSHATVNQAKAKENEEETAAKQRQENTIIQQIKEERTATVESLKREEMRAREREARVARIEEERREKQREAEQRAEEERTAQLLKEKAAQEEIEKKREEMEEKRAAEEERRMKRREERRKKETEERIATQIQEEMKRAKQREEERHAREEEARVAKEAEDKQRDKQRKEDRRVAQIQEERRTAQIEEERREKEEQEETTRREEEIRRVKHREIEQRIKEHEEMRAAELEERMKRKQEEAHRHEERPGESRKDEKQPAPVEADQPFPKHEEQQPFHTVEIEEEQPSQKVEQRKAALMMDALQYYAITSSANSKDKHPRSLVSPQRREESTRQESPLDESLSRPHAPSSPAPVPPRSTTSSPAPGPKPMMFRVKDNTLRASSLTKPVKPRLHKSFGEDFRVGSPQGDRRGSDRAEEEQVRARRSTGTPIHQDTVTRSNRHPSVKKSPPPQPQPPSFVPEPPAARAEYRPFSRRSMALDEEDSRSCISYMSEDVESFATSAADLADFRGFGEYDRPGSACSFSSDVSRSLGKPPSVPPKSDMALKRAQRLTTRRVKKELTKTPEEGPGPEENALRTPASSSSSSASELRSSYRHARASPHCSAPFSLSHAPASRAPSPRAEMPVANRYPHASPHAIGSVTSPHSGGPVSSPHAAMPVSIPVASPHATAPISFPVSSQHVAAPASLPLTSPRHALPASLPVAPQTIASTASSPVLRRRATPTGPVKQYHVEPGYSQSYPLTQPKVLQDPGSGQYYVVDMPVQVKTKTFFDPETGNYVQLNVRQSAHGGFRPLPQHTGYPQPQIPRLHVLSPARLYPQEADPGESYVVYPGYPPGPQSMPVSTLPPQRSFSGMSIPETLPQAPQSASQNYGYRSYNSEETPYMDTAYKTGTIYDANKVHHPSDKRPEGETPAPSGLQPHIITMSELEDFMDVSDW
ncbi:hypothetical protein NHX12_022210 [Muraenolepis orangiensis]|uniref:DUF4585 domain-containing protein n=1 Tax=Muraenolepis orangiensis TaxID=630683 RepID=A0A9Q0EN79_9TELE|nr:hypothetical protein NHX12_022210 [Muraenolepis orangiensis]